MNHLRLIPAACFILFISSCHAPDKQQKENRDRPNIVIIMSDDMGYSDIGCYGGEINTPNIDGLAKNGIRFTQFYNNSRCCPTRASLLTGKYAHQVNMVKNGRSLARDAATIAEILKENGYHTGITGKWHLSETKELADKEEQLLWLSHRKDSSVFAPLESYPCNRGFDEHHGIIWGVGSYFDPFSLVHNEEAITEVPEDFYLTDFITEKSNELIDQFSGDDKPFFLYVAYTSPHWPLHAPEENIEKYRGAYDKGWDALRRDRYERMLAMGLFDPETAPLAPNDANLKWEDCENKSWEARHMEAHAGMVDRMDQGIGMIIEKLREKGELENTFLLFLNDNGASFERGYGPGFDRPGHKRNGEKITYIIDPGDTIPPGPEETWGYLGKYWAGAVNAPFRRWKMESYEGGICTPFIVHWPEGLKGKENTINHGTGHVIDILPTCLELTQTEYPSEINDLATSPVEGKSLLPLIRKEVTITHDTLFWEHFGLKALRTGDWKMVKRGKNPAELYNLAENRTETNNLAQAYPEKVKIMEKAWQILNEKYNKKN